MEIIKLSSEVEVIEKLSTLIQQLANEAITTKGTFNIGLSGGSLVKYLSTGLPKVSTDWSKWRFFFCDERYVPVSDAESTFGLYKANLLPKVPTLSDSQFVIIDLSLPLDDCASDYEKKIRTAFAGSELPVFDLLLLGMGPDGHTCSLFPGHELLNETKRLVAPISDSPKPPPERVTMTYPLLNAAKCCIFASAGSGKAEMLKRILVDKEELPAGRVKPTNGKLIWIVDSAAGSQLP